MKEPPKKRRDQDYLKDIIEYAERAIEFCQGLNLEQFEKDSKTLFAATYCLQTIGEASSQLSDETRAELKDLPWKEMRGMRNLLVHAYHNADSDIVFLTIRNDLPPVISVLKKHLKQKT